MTNLSEMNAYFQEYRQYNQKVNQHGWKQGKMKMNKRILTWMNWVNQMNKKFYQVRKKMYNECE